MKNGLNNEEIRAIEAAAIVILCGTMGNVTQFALLPDGDDFHISITPHPLFWKPDDYLSLLVVSPVALCICSDIDDPDSIVAVLNEHQNVTTIKWLLDTEKVTQDRANRVIPELMWLLQMENIKESKTIMQRRVESMLRGAGGSYKEQLEIGGWSQCKPFIRPSR